MDLGLVFPTTEIGNDPALIKDYVQKAESLGFDHLLTYEHVLGTDPDRSDWVGPFDVNDPFHEPLTLFSHLAAVTESMEFVTGILILPQRQTALVAKQAAQLDRLSNGRFRMGVGLGWNEPEYQALGESFEDRAERIEEQVTVLRRLWSENVVTFRGRFHTIEDVGLNPRPSDGEVPLWMGGSADPVLDRIARQADGWLPQFQPGEQAQNQLDKLRKRCDQHGRSFEDVGIHGRVKLHESDSLPDSLREWDRLGADYLSINPMYGNWRGEEHLNQLDAIADRCGDWFDG